MRRKRWKIIRLAALTAGFAVRCLDAQELTREEAARLENYEARISSSDPAASDGLLREADLLARLAISDPGRAADLRSKAGAVAEYARLLDRNWTAAQERNLSQAMAVRLTEPSPLARAGLAPAPESTLAWAAKYRKYSAGKTALLARALRNWDAVFTGFIFNREMDLRGNTVWTVSNSSGVFFMDITRADAIFKESEAAMRALWEAMTLKERNSYMALKADEILDSFVSKSTRTDAGYIRLMESVGFRNYLNAGGLARLEKHIARMNSLELARSKLNAAELAQLKGQPVEQQLYLLGGIFDKSGVKGAVKVERKIDGLRPSTPREAISPENNRLLAGMLGPAMLSELRGSAAGDKLAGFYASGGRLEIAIESCQGCHAKYEPSSGRIIMDSELIQQYMRINNTDAGEMARSRGQLAGLARYLSPMLAHEGAHQMQHAWAENARVYKPYVQEDEEEASAMEALYTMEKLAKDAGFKSLMMKMRAAGCTYADKRLDLARTFKKNADDLGDRVRQVYYPGLPSFVAASTQILSAVSGELEKRKSLAPAELAEIERTGAGLEEAKAMAARELAGSAAGIKTAALRKIQDDLLHANLYENRYRSAGEWTGSMRQAVKTSAVPRGGVPAL